MGEIEMQIGAETFVWPQPGMVVVTVHGTPDADRQLQVHGQAESRPELEDHGRLLYILSPDADIRALEPLLAASSHPADGRRIAYAVSTSEQLAALQERPCCRPPEKIRVFSELTDACSWLAS